jgi:hypothetical protein
MNFQIKCRFTAKILFECEAESLKIAVEKAVEAKADLYSANLGGADLYSANLGGANLGGADLYSANLRGANLYSANLYSANLGGANLYSANLGGADLYSANLYSANLGGANLRGANLRGANLRGANLGGANLGAIKEDFCKILETAKLEVPGLYDALMRGKINGSTYSGECACLVGTIANVRNVDVNTLEQNASRPAERWFLGIRKGDVPSSNQISDITREWIEEFAKANEISLPTYRLISSTEAPEVFK